MTHQQDMTEKNKLAEMFKPKYLMVSSALCMGIIGVVIVFLTEHVVAFLGIQVAPVNMVFAKITGALYLGFATVNWMAKDNIIGGIYSRPVAMGNFIHFLLIFFSLLKFVIYYDASVLVVITTICYALFALGFTYLLQGKGKSCG